MYRKTSMLLVTVLLLIVAVTTTTAVHDQAFQLDGDTSSIDQDPGPGMPGFDWEDLFDVTSGVASPKDPLPADFISAFFARDFVPGESGPDRTTFATGSKDTLNVTPGWQCARDNNVNDKTDLVNVFATAYVDPNSGELKLYFALERYSNEGAGNVAFWFLQDGTVNCEAPASGPSTTDFTGNHRDGDLLVVSEFTVGGKVSSIIAYQWVGGAGGFLDTTPVASGVDCKDDEVGGDTICATVNSIDADGSPLVFTSPWLTETKQPGPDPSTENDVSEFFEGGISLTNLGHADRCFNRMLADTRSSPSLTATIFDYAIGDLPVCNLKVTKDGDTLSKEGDDVNYTITIENTGGITLYKQSIVDSLFGDLTDGTNTLITASDCGASLAAGDSCTINVTRTVQAGDDDPLPNTVTVIYDSRADLLGDEITREDSHSVNLFQPSIAFDKAGDATLSKEGDTVNYTLTPNLTCTITDAVLGINEMVNLASGESHVINQAQVMPAAPDPYVNTASVSCQVDGFSNVLEAADSWTVNLFQPSIAFDKSADTMLSKEGDTVNYTLTLDNTSSADSPNLTCTITDAVLGINEMVNLASGESHVINQAQVMPAEPDPYVNTASVSCQVDGFSNVLEAADSWTVNLFQPSVTIDKTGDDLSKVTDPVDYVITVTNTSSDDSPNLTCTISDPLLGINKVVNLASGGVDVTNATRVVQEGDLDPLVNTASVTCSVDGFPNVLGPVSDSHTTELFQPAVEVIKTGPDIATIGEIITYDFTINNLSSTDSPDLILDSVTDTWLGDLTTFALDAGCGTLGFGGTCNFNVNYEIQPTDPSTIVNVVTVHYHPEGFPNDIMDDDDHVVEIPNQGCTPGFWQGGAGSIQWDGDNDPDWTGEGTNPFTHNTLFNDFFDDAGDVNSNGLTDVDPRLDGLTMFDLVSTGGGSSSAEKAARDMVAAYLNETAFPSTFPADSLLALEIMWYDAVAGGDAGLDAFHVTVSAWNDPEEPGFCPLP